MNKHGKSLTDWNRVRREIAEDAPIPYDPEDGPYDPNDEAATEAYWAEAIITGPRERELQGQVTPRLSPQVLAHFKATGEGWQTRIDETLKKAIRTKPIKKAVKARQRKKAG